MNAQKRSETTFWSPSSGGFAVVVLIVGVCVIIAGSIDVFSSLQHFRQVCAGEFENSTCAAVTAPTTEAVTAETTPEPLINEIRFVTSYQLNVRRQAGADSDVVFVLNQGDQVRLLGERREVDGSTWAVIESDGRRGWVNTKFLRF